MPSKTKKETPSSGAVKVPAAEPSKTDEAASAEAAHHANPEHNHGPKKPGFNANRFGGGPKPRGPILKNRIVRGANRGR